MDGYALRTLILPAVSERSKPEGTIHGHSHRHSHLIMDPGSAFYDHFRGGFAPSDVIVECRCRIHDQMAVSVAVAVDCALRLRTFAQKFLT